MSAAIAGASSGRGRGCGSRIVATGCTGGIGLHFIRQLLLSPPSAQLPPPYHILLLARKPSAPHVVRARQELEAMSAAQPQPQPQKAGAGEGASEGETFVEVREMDLASLRSVRMGARGLLSHLSPKNATASASSGSSASASTSTLTAASARAFERIAPGRIDVLLLNAAVAKAKREFVVDEDAAAAGTQQTGDRLSDAEGRYEESACVNHVSQQLLVALLSPALLGLRGSRSSEEPQPGTQDHSAPPVPRIVFTSSALHRQIKDVKHLDAFFDPAYTAPSPSSTPSGSSSSSSSGSSTAPPAWSLMGSYGASKFLQMLGVQRLLKQLQCLPHPSTHASSSSSSSSRPRIELIAVQPGFIPSTGLSRETSPLARFATRWVLPLLAPLVSFIATPGEGGEMLLRACTRPVRETPLDEREGFAPAEGWEGEVRKGVRKTLLVRSRGGQRAERQRPDLRSEKARLMEEWWPEVVRREWERQVGTMKEGGGQ